MADGSHPFSRTWFVAQLKPNQHLIARQNLGRQGIEHCMPEIVRDKLTTKGLRPYRSALFPGYLFVAIDLTSPSWARIRNTRGISRLISFGDGMPCPLPAAFMEELLQRIGEDGLLVPEPALEHGSFVRVKRGPFTDFIGEVQRLDDERRAWVLIDFLGQLSRVGISTGDLELLRSVDL